jgi:DNA-binding NtrC family response regulator/tetratricopeptide (TPR) repeat protein
LSPPRPSPARQLDAPLSESRALTPFGRLDDFVRVPDAFGVVVARLARGGFGAMLRHLERRVREGDRPLVVALPSGPSTLWRDLARGLALAATSDPVELGRAIAEAMAGGVIVAAPVGVEGAWARAVREEIESAAVDPERRLLCILLSASEDPVAASRAGTTGALPIARGAAPEPASVLHVELGPLSAADARRWWDAVMAREGLLFGAPFDRLEAVDGWWQRVRAQGHGAPAAPELSAAAAELASYLAHAEQSLSVAQATALAPPRALDELIERGLAVVDRAGRIAGVDGTRATPLDAARSRRLGAVLADGAATQCADPGAADPWVTMRAAELHAAGGDADRAEALALAALANVSDGAARDELWGRWAALLGRPFGDASASPAAGHETAHLGRLLRSADRALALGEADRADALVRRAMAIDEGGFEVLLLHARAAYARGDVTAAALAGGRALGASRSLGDRARAAAVMAEVRYLAGDFAQADRYARQAAERGESPTVRLEARNVLGKLLLAREVWDEAEQHFAADALEAARVADDESELRARINRAIAVMRLGRHEHARRLLEEAHRDGQERGIPRAEAYALSNLGTLAVLEHRYGDALALLEQSIEVRRKVDNRGGLVKPIANLAELRMRLGMLEEAEQLLRFGAQICGPSLPLWRQASFAVVAAQVRLARGDTASAQREVATAIAGSRSAGDRALLAQCHRVAARIALEDGDLLRAEGALSQAQDLKHSAFGQAELAGLLGAWERASGRPFAESARRALALAEQADDPESLREARVLLFHAHRLEGDEATARVHLRAALAHRDAVADSLPPALRERYLGRRAVEELASLEPELDGRAAGVRAAASQPLLGAPSLAGGAEEADGGRPVATALSTRRLVGDAAPMRGLRATIERVAVTDANVLVLGPTGAGKELVAEAIHRGSARRNRPLVKVNCAALVETLLLSELFGHEKGAFTGASSRRRGRFEVAEGGTLFLDEIGDISARTQVALLRVLQDGTFERVGGCQQLRANVRIVCATHRDLRAMVERGEFREDLYYRLCGVVLEVPALRDRLSDLPQLCQALLEQAERTSGIQALPIARDALRALARHGWPGNVRELENALRVAALFAKGPDITLADFVENVESLRHLSELPPPSSRSSVPPPGGDAAPRSASEARAGGPAPGGSSAEIVYAEVRGGQALGQLKRHLERECIARALIESGGNITRAATLLGMKRPRLSQLVKHYKLTSVVEDIKS